MPTFPWRSSRGEQRALSADAHSADGGSTGPPLSARSAFRSPCCGRSRRADDSVSPGTGSAEGRSPPSASVRYASLRQEATATSAQAHEAASSADRVQQRLEQVRDEAFQAVRDTLRNEVTPDMITMADMFLCEARAGVEQLQQQVDSCMMSERFDLVEQIYQTASEYHKLHEQVTSWRDGASLVVTAEVEDLEFDEENRRAENRQRVPPTAGDRVGAPHASGIASLAARTALMAASCAAAALPEERGAEVEAGSILSQRDSPVSPQEGPRSATVPPSNSVEALGGLLAGAASADFAGSATAAARGKAAAAVSADHRSHSDVSAAVADGQAPARTHRKGRALERLEAETKPQAETESPEASGPRSFDATGETEGEAATQGPHTSQGGRRRRRPRPQKADVATHSEVPPAPSLSSAHSPSSSSSWPSRAGAVHGPAAEPSWPGEPDSWAEAQVPVPAAGVTEVRCSKTSGTSQHQRRSKADGSLAGTGGGVVGGNRTDSISSACGVSNSQCPLVGGGTGNGGDDGDWTATCSPHAKGGSSSPVDVPPPPSFAVAPWPGVSAMQALRASETQWSIQGWPQSAQETSPDKFEPFNAHHTDDSASKGTSHKTRSESMDGSSVGGHEKVVPQSPVTKVASPTEGSASAKKSFGEVAPFTPGACDGKPLLHTVPEVRGAHVEIGAGGEPGRGCAPASGVHRASDGPTTAAVACASPRDTKPHAATGDGQHRPAARGAVVVHQPAMPKAARPSKTARSLRDSDARLRGLTGKSMGSAVTALTATSAALSATGSTPECPSACSFGARTRGMSPRSDVSRSTVAAPAPTPTLDTAAESPRTSLNRAEPATACDSAVPSRVFSGPAPQSLDAPTRMPIATADVLSTNYTQTGSISGGCTPIFPPLSAQSVEDVEEKETARRLEAEAEQVGALDLQVKPAARPHCSFASNNAQRVAGQSGRVAEQAKTGPPPHPPTNNDACALGAREHGVLCRAPEANAQGGMPERLPEPTTALPRVLPEESQPVACHEQVQDLPSPEQLPPRAGDDPLQRAAMEVQRLRAELQRRLRAGLDSLPATWGAFPQDRLPACTRVDVAMPLATTASTSATLHIPQPYVEISGDVDGFQEQFARAAAQAAGVPPHRIRVVGVQPGVPAAAGRAALHMASALPTGACATSTMAGRGRGPQRATFGTPTRSFATTPPPAEDGGAEVPGGVQSPAPAAGVWHGRAAATAHATSIVGRHGGPHLAMDRAGV